MTPLPIPPRRCRSLIKDQRGASLIELALVSPILLLMVLGMVDAAMGFSMQLKLQQAAARTIELATAGGISSAAFQNLQTEAATASDQSADHVTVDKWLTCDGARQSAFDGVCADGQQVARFVSISIQAVYVPILTGAMSAVGLPTSIALEGNSSVRVQ
jgi:Flp pilus assembly protein TadG